MAYNADKRSLVCDYCGNRLHEYQALQQGALISEQDFTVALATAKGHRWELPVERTLKCEGVRRNVSRCRRCKSAAQCPFCGSAHVVTASTGELIEPEGILPFQFDAVDAGKRIRSWLDHLKFRPDDLDDRAAISNPRKVFLPFWTFDLGGTMNWNAQVEEGYGKNTSLGSAQRHVSGLSRRSPGAGHARHSQGCAGRSDRIRYQSAGPFLGRTAVRCSSRNLSGAPGRRVAGGAPARPAHSDKPTSKATISPGKPIGTSS